MPPDDLSYALPERSARAALPHVAIVGATGAVGVELRACLEWRGFPLASLRLLATPRSAGQTAAFAGWTLTVEVLDERSFEAVDLALFSAGASVSRRYAPLAVRAGAVVVQPELRIRGEGIPKGSRI
jgi:aspartate-semialdehyde dehydrogenase